MEGLPKQDEVFLTVGIAATNVASSLSIDRSGRSIFNADYTVWMLSPPAFCRALPDDELDEIEYALAPLLDEPCQDCSQPPAMPYLVLIYTTNNRERSFFYDTVRKQSPERERALEVILAALHRTYGSRFARELRGAGLLSLLPDSPKSD